MASPKRSAARRRSLGQRLRADFIAGLAVVLPAGLTVMLLTWAVRLIDARVLPLVPVDLPFSQVAGAGVVVFVLVTIRPARVTRHMLGQRAVLAAEQLVARVPVARQLYGGAKQIVETAIRKGGTSFRQTVLVEYPERGIWQVVVLTAPVEGELPEKTRRARPRRPARPDRAEPDHRLPRLRAAAGPDPARHQHRGRRQARLLGRAGRAAGIRAAEGRRRTSRSIHATRPRRLARGGRDG